MWRLIKLFVYTTCIYIGFCGAGQSGRGFADTINIHWLNEDHTTYDTTTCTVGGNLSLPTAPTKRGYTFTGWEKLLTPIQYIESTGTQWIDTGFYPNQDSRMVIDFYSIRSEKTTIAFVANQTSNNVGYDGFGVSQDTNHTSVAMVLRNGQYDWRPKTTDIYGAGTGRYVVDINKQNITITASNGSTLTNTIQKYNYQMPTSLWLFVYRSVGISPSEILYPNVRIYSCKLYDNGTLVRDFIPVLDHDGVACMYDKVSNRFFYNSGTGDFIAGPEITE